jgi:hypothetical protein
MTASGVLFPIGGAEDEGCLGRYLVVAPGSTVISTVAQSRSLEVSLAGIASNLEAAEERLAAAASSTDVAGPHVRELHEIWLLVAALMTASVTPPDHLPDPRQQFFEAGRRRRRPPPPLSPQRTPPGANQAVSLRCRPDQPARVPLNRTRCNRSRALGIAGRSRPRATP